jgi:hypothetical protein
MKYAAYLGIASALLLMAFCFMPWAYYPDLQQNFTGFYSVQNTYGKPGIALIFLAVMAIVLFLIPKLWAKRTNQFISVLIFAYSLKSFILFTGSYGGIHPEIKPGLVGTLLFSFVMLVCSLLSKGDFKEEG